MDNIFIFDDEFKSKLLPLVYLRPSCDLRCGILTIREKMEISAKKLKSISKKYSVFINGRLLIDDSIISIIKKSHDECLLIKEGQIAAAIIENADVLKNKDFLTTKDFEKLRIKKQNINAEFITYPWDLIYKNSKEIESDVKRLNLISIKNTKKYSGVYFINKKNIFIGKNIEIKPCTVLDASEGPIIIDDNAKILPNSTIIGPVYVGKYSIIKAGAKIYQGTSIGPFCKVGGEVEGSIFLGYSNKQHDGFIGHSYICEWVNLGAGTNNSDLKNNYSNVSVWNDGKIIDSGLLFMGLIIGDHSKSAIGTTFNTGTVIGVSSNIFGAGFPEKFIPSFSWGGVGKITEYDFEKALQTAKVVMKRRNIEMTKEYAVRLRDIFDEIALKRKALL